MLLVLSDLEMPIAEHGNTRLTAFDMFSGCGGLTEGLKAADFVVLGAVELDAFAAETYRLNHPEVKLWETDVRKLSGRDVLDTLGLAAGQLDLLAGCPPCQGFSTLRTRNGARASSDKRNTLLMEFLRLVVELLPRTIMLENVPGLEQYRLFEPFCAKLKQLGYVGQHRVLDAARFDVPQRRKRLIYLAGQGESIAFAEPSVESRTVRTGIGALKKAGESGDPLHDFPERRSNRIAELIASIPKNGGSRKDLPPEYRLTCHETCNGFKDVYGRMNWDKVAPTITSGCFNPSRGRFLHPEEDRAITIREASLLQGFPLNYKFPSRKGKTALALMIGNALPPPLIQRQATAVATFLREQRDRQSQS